MVQQTTRGAGSRGADVRRRATATDTGARPATAAPAGKKAGPRTPIGAWLAGPLASFHLIVTLSALLTLLGLIMVLSASSVEAYATDGSAYSLFTEQLIYAGVGAVLFYLGLRTKVSTLRRLSFPALVISVLLLVMVLVPGIGIEAQGARRWFLIGPLSLQPSETTKVVLAVWGAHLLASRRRENASVKEMIVPLVPVSLVIFALVVLEPNLSTTIALGIILIALLWFAGLPLRVFGGILGAGVALAIVLAFTAGYRSQRIRAFLHPGADTQGSGYQSKQAKFSLADGGLFGRGLGQSRAKWSYLPNAHNDFIFAILGEELGFVGCAVVFGLFALFAYTGMRIALRSLDPFLRLLVGTATVWTIGQAFINIGYVVGILPVTGLQLPLISAGGSSTAMTLLMFGIIANAARHEPEAIAALQAGKEGRFWRLLRLPMPVPYSPQHPFGERATRKKIGRVGAKVPRGERVPGAPQTGDRSPDPRGRRTAGAAVKSRRSATPPPRQPARGRGAESYDRLPPLRRPDGYRPDGRYEVRDGRPGKSGKPGKPGKRGTGT